MNSFTDMEEVDDLATLEVLDEVSDLQHQPSSVETVLGF